MEYQDYYATLGVEKGASKQDIQKAYRKLARKHHPDISQGAESENRFREINEAYEVLKDDDKRARYDQFGSAWKQAQRTGAPPPGFEEVFSQFGFGGAGFGGRGARVEFDLGNLGNVGNMGGRGRTGGGDFSSFFEALFGSSGAASGGGWSGFGSAPGRPEAGRGLDQEARIAISLEEASRGGKREITLGDGTRGRKRRLRVNLPSGIRPGQKIRLAGQGAKGAGGRRGDLYLTVELLPHPSFRLLGANLHTHLAVTPWEAALGGQASIRTLDGEVKVRIPPGSSSGRKIRLRGRGFPSPSGGNGDLLAEIRVMVPDELSENERRLFEELAATSDFRLRGERAS